MYTKYSHLVKNKLPFKKGGSQREQATTTVQTIRFKKFHHIKLDMEFKFDCQIWLEFLKNNSYCTRPMIDIDMFATSEEISFCSDTSAARHLGYGCIFGTKWLFGCWEDGFIDEKCPSIEYLELFALMAGLLMWEQELANCRIAIFCDNTAVVEMINNNASSCKNCMFLLRILTLNGLQFNQRVSAKYINTKANFLADALSRQQIAKFKWLGPHMNEHPDKISPSIWLISRIWQE